MKLIISLKCCSFWERLVAWITTFPTALGYTYKIYLIGMLPVYTRHTHIPILKAFSQKIKEINFTVPSERTSSECWTLQICPRVKRNPSCSLCPSVCVCVFLVLLQAYPSRLLKLGVACFLSLHPSALMGTLCGGKLAGENVFHMHTDGNGWVVCLRSLSPACYLQKRQPRAVFYFPDLQVSTRC